MRTNQFTVGSSFFKKTNKPEATVHQKHSCIFS